MLGRPLPDMALPASDGSSVNLRQQAGLCVSFCYPYTGKPGIPNPEGWDRIPGAHGSTPQALGYSALYAAFRERRAEVFGLSFDASEWQKDFDMRNQLGVRLLSDDRHQFASALRLPTFKAGARSFLKRMTLIARDGIVIAVRNAIERPGDDAQATLVLLDEFS
jgi:peroxiredoxin